MEITPPLKKSLSNRYFFQNGDENCYPLDYHEQYMEENNLKQLDVFLARRETGTGYFFCKHFQETGETGHCGEHCSGYAPRNGKNGICKHHGCVYEQTEQRFTLKNK